MDWIYQSAHGHKAAKGRWIRHWYPNDRQFWRMTGSRVARRNLRWSVLAEHIGFSVWMLWSIVAVRLADRHFSDDQLFWLVALPNLVGAVVRIPYTFAPARFGGRNWTVVSALLLLIPAVLLAWAVSNPATPYWAFLAIAASAGLGGGNFASSMANITHFYPANRQGYALGVNAAGGNIGVSSVQLVVPIIATAFGLAAAGLMWVPLILLAAVAAGLRMDNLAPARSNVRDQLRAAGRSHTWVMSVLYVGTFGSFIGYASAFPLLTKTQFPEMDVARYAFLGALVGSLARPFGGWLADRLGGARVTYWNFVLMGGGAGAVWASLQRHNYLMFLGAFLILFITSGIGNGSTYRMIPSIFHTLAVAGTRDQASYDAAAREGRRVAAAVLGITSAVGALGGFLINLAFGASIARTGHVSHALVAFVGYYGLCLVLTWWCYVRRRAVWRAPSFAEVRV